VNRVGATALSPGTIRRGLILQRALGLLSGFGDTVAREYREKHLRSPDKRPSMAMPFHSRNKHNLTLKEQNSKIDKLSKREFRPKLKIHFLDQALQNRSDEGVKEMISKNVQLQTDLANEKKENQSLRRKVRDLERKMKAQEDGLAAGTRDDQRV